MANGSDGGRCGYKSGSSNGNGCTTAQVRLDNVLFQALFLILLRRSLAFDLVAIIAVLKLRMILTAKSAYSSGLRKFRVDFLSGKLEKSLHMN